MTLSELSIRRHVLAVMISALIMLFGAIAYQEVGTDRIPDIDFPIVSVTVYQDGAEPELIDSAITEEVERAVNTVPGIDDVQSVSLPSTSVVTVSFDLDVDVDVAFNEVNAKVSEIVQDLPQDAEAPVVDKVELDAQPVMWLSLQGDRKIQDLDRYARNEIRPRLEGISGVGEIRVGGGRERTMRIEVCPERMAAHNLDVRSLLNALEQEHAQMPGGFMVGGETEDMLKLDIEYHDAEELEQMIVASDGDEQVRLKHVADVIDGLADKRQLARANAEPTIGLGVVKISGANTVAIIEEVKERLDDEIRPQLPPGMELSISTDESEFILEQIDSLFLTIALGILFAGLVMWVFLRNLRSTGIIALAIPVSLMAAIGVIYFFGYTLNSITMLAMLLLIGVVVDDAIVVLENIYRHRKQYGKGRIAAAISGSNEVFFAVIASSLSLISIFGSVLFMEAIIGRFFESFAVVVAFGVLASSLVALTLIPMLASRFLHVPEREPLIYAYMERGFGLIESAYRWLLRGILRFRWTTLGIALAFAVGVATLIAPQVGGEFAPEEDTSEFMVTFQVPLGSSIHYTDARMSEVEQVLLDQPEVERIFAAIGLGDRGQVNRGMAFVRLTERNEREASQREIMDRVQPKLGQISGIRAFASEVPLVPGSRGEPLQFVVTGPSFHELGEHAEQIQQHLEEIDGMGSLDLDLDLELPQLEIKVDRERANAAGLNALQVSQAINILAGGADVARFDEGPEGEDGRRYDVRMKAQEGLVDDIDSLLRIQLLSEEGEMVPLESVTEINPTVGPAAVTRHNLAYSADFYGDPDMPLADAIDKVNQAGEEILPLGYDIEFVGQAEEMQRAASAMIFVLALAATLVYIVLSSQFNSFIQPLIIMAAQPLALVGGILGLYVGGFTLNIYSMIGMVLLMGLVTKNGILLVDLTNQYREKRGLSINEALADACPIRLRPVLMTSLTLILALIPAVVGIGAGAESNAPMAAAIIGGMITAMLLTLAVIPAAYSLAEGFLERRGWGRGNLADDEESAA
ncbi:RND multidrug efflux transporter [Halorhodospira halochloris]|uniref:RND multidrug efflux transporter n=1 Tax=Halorhodospira halochloris TaxID=1052 RepID=A0A125T2Q5_HALHR|nr:efflux RND transporter permease subunit [Halorhodospira halochloris]MBK1652175.1 acriflavin resistance protein [Halorhodospira halochloris]BAU58406.1 RND multidrug efflux transporter [Halorhodospira halochloris]